MVDLKKCVNLCAQTYADGVPVLRDGDYLAFRGTVDARDMAEDAAALLTPWGPWRVHQGFLKALIDRTEAIQAAVKWPLIPETLVITGHSLGAALAIMTAMWLDALCCKVSVVTFGCPKLGDAALADGIEFPVTRVVNDHDIVPHLPPLFEYRSIGSLLWYDRDRQPHERTFMPISAELNWQDHHIQKYVELFP